jgi:hypothetical protein
MRTQQRFILILIILSIFFTQCHGLYTGACEAGRPSAKYCTKGEGGDVRIAFLFPPFCACHRDRWKVLLCFVPAGLLDNLLPFENIPYLEAISSGVGQTETTKLTISFISFAIHNMGGRGD